MIVVVSKRVAGACGWLPPVSVEKGEGMDELVLILRARARSIEMHCSLKSEY